MSKFLDTLPYFLSASCFNPSGKYKQTRKHLSPRYTTCYMILDKLFTFSGMDLYFFINKTKRLKIIRLYYYHLEMSVIQVKSYIHSLSTWKTCLLFVMLITLKCHGPCLSYLLLNNWCIANIICRTSNWMNEYLCFSIPLWKS